MEGVEEAFAGVRRRSLLVLMAMTVADALGFIWSVFLFQHRTIIKRTIPMKQIIPKAIATHDPADRPPAVRTRIELTE